MVAVFCRVTAELAPDFINNFPKQFDFCGMLSKICDDIDVGISYQNEIYLLQGDWNSLGRAYNMLVSTLAVYGNASSVCNGLSNTVAKDSRPFSALVEAAEAISRGVELQEQVQNEMTQMNKSSEYISVQHFPFAYSDHEYDKVSRYTQNSVDEQRSSSEGSFHESEEHLFRQKSIHYSEASESHRETQVNIDSLSETTNKEESAKPVNESSIKSDSDLPKQVKSQDSNTEYRVLPNQSQENISDIESPNGFTCTECDFKVDSKVSLSEHISRCHQNPMAKCDICDKIFISVRYMKRHRSCHKDASYNCAECGKNYKVLKALKEHQKTHEKDYVKPQFKCETCPKTFCSTYLKECHVKSEHLGLKKRFLCQTCGKSFTTKHTLQQHVNAHIGKRPYHCLECGKSFTYEAALRDHKFTHVELKTFVCEYPECEKSFRQRSALKMHEKIHKNPNQFACNECGRGFTQKQALQRHIRSHKGLKPFRCKYCGRTFGDAAIIRRHMKLVHKVNKDIDKWREDIIEEEITDDKEIPISDTLPNATVLSPDDIKDNPYKQHSETISPGMRENSGQNEESNLGSELSTNHIQSVFVSYDVPSQNLVLANTAAAEFSQSTTHLIQYHFKQTEDAETGSNSTELTEIESVNSKPEALQDHLLQQENDAAFIEKEQIQFLTENLDGTFNTTVDFRKLKRNLELLTKPNATEDLNLASDIPAETLKPDGTVAEVPQNSGLENIRCSDMESLSDNLGLSSSQCQYYYYNLGNQFLNVNPNQLNPSLNAPDTSPDRGVP